MTGGNLADAIETRTVNRVFWRLVPLLFLMMFFNYVDRVNVGFAALRMNQELGFSPTIYGTGAAIFFWGYVILQVPSNLIVYRVGARIWLMVILFAWGSVSAATAFVRDATSFYILRFALGLAEAGFLPAAALYVTYWFPEAHRARAISGYIIATSCSTIIGGPIAGAIITYLDRFVGLSGWQWMFLLEGVPSLLLGVVVFFLLTDKPKDASWLDQESRDWLGQRLAAERAALAGNESPAFSTVLTDVRVWMLGLLFGCGLIGLYGLILWLPLIIKSLGQLSDLQVGFLSAVPPALGVAGALLVSRHSDRVGDRKGHMAGCYIVSGLGLLASALVSDPILAYIFLCIGNGAVLAASPLFWTIAGSFFTGAAAATCIAVVNIIAQFGGVGPYLIGVVKDATGSFTLALVTLAAFSFLAAAIAILMKAEAKPAPAAAPAE
ncbi:MAG TPA: MFS transporter [Micropepsaceae bacterium]|nr:MFS transporter [Micropepsaceae bacterium]